MLISIEHGPLGIGFPEDDEDMTRLRHACTMRRARQIRRQRIAAPLMSCRLCGKGAYLVLFNPRDVTARNTLLHSARTIECLPVIENTFIEEHITRDTCILPVHSAAIGKTAAEPEKNTDRRNEEHQPARKENALQPPKARQRVCPARAQQVPQKDERNERQQKCNTKAPDKPVFLKHCHENCHNIIMQSRCYLHMEG